MLHKMTAFMSEFHMIEPGDCIVAGVSGGADSVCMLHLLLALREEMPFTLSVLHVDHGIRSDAWEDAEFVRHLCAEQDIPFTLVKEDVPSYAAAHRMGEEEAGRCLRYRAFEKVNEQLYGGAAKFAVAHNQNDCAETVLFHLFRGTGIHGLCGMKPIQGKVIRPLLNITRQEIETWLDGSGIPYRTDSTNHEDDYARNRIRHHILSYAEQEICAGSTSHIAQAADMLSQAAEYLDAQTKEAYAACVNEKRELHGVSLNLSAERFLGLHPYLKGSVVHLCFSQLVPAAKDLGFVHVNCVCALFEKQTGRRLTLPYGIRAQRTYEGVCLERGAVLDEKAPVKQAGQEEILLEGSSGTVVFGGKRFMFRVFACDGKEEFLQSIPKNNCTKWFDYDRIKKPLVIRCRRAGDYLTVNAAGGTKSLKKYMIDEKIPAEERGHIALVAEEDHILWVTGYRVSEAYKVTADTKRIIEIYMSGGKENG